MPGKFGFLLRKQFDPSGKPNCIRNGLEIIPNYDNLQTILGTAASVFP